MVKNVFRNKMKDHLKKKKTITGKFITKSI